ncbi:phosphatidylinositol-specific phospholipase C domain-containing protein [Lysobacter silvisoli]|nr:phosphatidylinositol-specific phospholipase C domain-containing protein [Lysobacter silvisoli]
MPQATRGVVGDWMRYIDDGRYLSELSIPGTHDSVTALFHSGIGMVEGWTRCQDLMIEEQLQRGIRFLDIRLRYDSSGKQPVLRLCHGKSDMERDFGYVLGVCERFLSAHNHETIVVSIKNDRPDQDDARAFAQLFEATIGVRARSEYWHTGKTVPTLGEVRRKMVLLRRYSEGTQGIDATYWPRNCPFRKLNGDGVSFDVQDEFEVYTHANRDKKFDAYVLDTLRDAVNDKDPHKLFINFASGTGTVWPATLAETTNPKLYGYFVGARPGRYGIVPMDYPEQFTGGMQHDLIAAIVSANPSDRLCDWATYELRPRLALDSRLTVLGDGHSVGIFQALPDIPLPSLPGLLGIPPPLALPAPLPTSASQRWQLQDAGNGRYRLHSMSDRNKVLTVAGGSTADGTAITAEQWNDQAGQLWKFDREGGAFSISPKHAPHSVLDVYGANTANGSAVKLYHHYPSTSLNNAFAQRWVLVRVA